MARQPSASLEVQLGPEEALPRVRRQRVAVVPVVAGVRLVDQPAVLAWLRRKVVLVAVCRPSGPIAAASCAILTAAPLHGHLPNPRAHHTRIHAGLRLRIEQPVLPELRAGVPPSHGRRALRAVLRGVRLVHVVVRRHRGEPIQLGRAWPRAAESVSRTSIYL